MKPTKDLVLIQADTPKEQTSSGIFVIEEWKSLPHTGAVLAVGPDVTELTPGEHVLFERYASVILENNQRLCKESHVLARLDENA